MLPPIGFTAAPSLGIAFSEAVSILPNLPCTSLSPSELLSPPTVGELLQVASAQRQPLTLLHSFKVIAHTPVTTAICLRMLIFRTRIEEIQEFVHCTSLNEVRLPAFCLVGSCLTTCFGGRMISLSKDAKPFRCLSFPPIVTR